MAKKLVEININGLMRELAVEPWASLAELLRDQLGLTGVKIGCNRGHCGGCTVLLDGKPVSSCLVLAVEADKREVFTAEGLLADEAKAAPLLEALAGAGLAADPFAAPGLTLAAHAALKERKGVTAGHVRADIAGNIVAGLGYDQIIQALGDGEKEGR